MNSELFLSPYLFPAFFVGMWLLVSTILMFAAGWFSLQQRYETGSEPALLTLRGRSGSMGMGVDLNGILTLRACPSGLRISIWKIFAPFQRPILVPWKDISATPSRTLFAPATQLSFGSPEVGRLKIDARSWQRLRDAAAEFDVVGLPPATPRISATATAKGLFGQWLVITLGAGCFFYFVPRLQGDQGSLPLTICFGFPAIIFGMALGISFLRRI